MDNRQKAYLVQAPNKDWLVISYGNPDALLGTFRNRKDAEKFLKLKRAEEE